MRWEGHVEYIGEMRMRTKLFLESVKGRKHSDNLGVDGKIILKLILGYWVWTGFIWLRKGTAGGLL
jgi:hypothetical protein